MTVECAISEKRTGTSVKNAMTNFDLSKTG